jgi:hypothetical protein
MVGATPIAIIQGLALKWVIPAKRHAHISSDYACGDYDCDCVYPAASPGWRNTVRHMLLNLVDATRDPDYEHHKFKYLNKRKTWETN